MHRLAARTLSSLVFNKQSKITRLFAKPSGNASSAKSGKEAQVKRQEVEDEPISHTEATQYYEQRCQSVQDLIKAGGVKSPYPHKWHSTLSITNFVSNYSDKTIKEGDYLPEQVSVAGRITSVRKSGSNLFFFDVTSDGAHMQVIVNQQSIGNAEKLKEIDDLVKRSDIVGFKGNPGRSKRGELSLLASEVVLLSPCLHMMPRERTGIKDPEVRFRQRYLDLLINKGIREKFIARHKMLSFLRRYLDERGFVEVETPILALQSGGATAKPFKTYHNDLKLELNMRVAPELYLKNLIIGGFEKVYEIGKNFRNEGIDHNHNPEFTAIEFYWAYADYNDLMNFAEDLISSMVKHVCGSTKIKVRSRHSGEIVEIDFAGPWKRISIVSELEKILKIKIPDVNDPKTTSFLDKLCQEKGVACSSPRTTSRLLDKLVGHFIEPDCTQPTFLMDHPQIMSPLAKPHRSLPGMTERFELFVNQYEIMNAYTELNDPFIQRSMFESQMRVGTSLL
jgi:lysyl-tRNA synthetase class 2